MNFSRTTVVQSHIAEVKGQYYRLSQGVAHLYISFVQFMSSLVERTLANLGSYVSVASVEGKSSDK